MKSQNLFTIIAIVVALALFSLMWLKQGGKQMPDISFTDIDGQSHSLEQYRGKPILVIFWATDCPGCIHEMPDLIALHHDYASHGLAMVSVAMPHDTVAHIQAMREQKGLPYTITWDADGTISEAFDNVRVTPTHFLINPDGEIVMRKIGTLNLQDLRERLNKMGLANAKV